jgi:lipid-A-disaccharide synthase
MKYYLIAGEASGDLHASHLMEELQRQDPQAEFRYYGGDNMQAVGGTLVKHYKKLAYMGFIPVFLHLPTILLNMRRAKNDVKAWQPDVVILIDYPGFNLKIAKYVKKNAIAPVYYYISPKIWAWKEYRIKNIKRDVETLFSILPFEVDFFEGKHHYPIHYVGNPTADEVRAYLQSHVRTEEQQAAKTIAILCGSRRQEIRDNLPAMLQVTDKYSDKYQVVIAGAPSIDPDYYSQFMEGHKVSIVFNQTYDLLSKAHAALVTSGTATLETALFGVPQVVCYEGRPHWFFKWLRKKLLKVKYVSLVNLIADSEVVPELVVNTFSAENIEKELSVLLPSDSPQRQQMLQGYRRVEKLLGHHCPPANAARLIISSLSHKP